MMINVIGTWRDTFVERRLYALCFELGLFVGFGHAGSEISGVFLGLFFVLIPCCEAGEFIYIEGVFL